jgi:hypothetical protein
MAQGGQVAALGHLGFYKAFWPFFTQGGQGGQLTRGTRTRLRRPPTARILRKCAYPKCSFPTGSKGVTISAGTIASVVARPTSEVQVRDRVHRSCSEAVWLAGAPELAWPCGRVRLLAIPLPTTRVKAPVRWREDTPQSRAEISCRLKTIRWLLRHRLQASFIQPAISGWLWSDQSLS